MDKYSELYAFLYRSAKKLISDFENMLLIVRDEKFPAEMEEFVGKLQRLADHATHEIEDLTPVQEETEETPVQEETEEFQITNELCEEAFRAGFAAKDFSVAFLQRQFRLKYIDACNLQDALRQDGKIKRAFLVGDEVCKG